MPGIHLKDDLYVHNEVHTHTYVVDVHVTCKWRVTFYHTQRCKWLMTSTYLVCKECFCVVLRDIGITTDLNINSAKVNIVLRRVL